MMYEGIIRALLLSFFESIVPVMPRRCGFQISDKQKNGMNQTNETPQFMFSLTGLDGNL